jgi:hypothetical protein
VAESEREVAWSESEVSLSADVLPATSSVSRVRALSLVCMTVNMLSLSLSVAKLMQPIVTSEPPSLARSLARSLFLSLSMRAGAGALALERNRSCASPSSPAKTRWRPPLGAPPGRSASSSSFSFAARAAVGVSAVACVRAASVFVLLYQ